MFGRRGSPPQYPLHVKPKDLDAIAALVLLEDYLQREIKWPDKPNIKTLL